MPSAPLLLRLPPGATWEQRAHLLASISFVAGIASLLLCCTAPVAAATGGVVLGAARRRPVADETARLAVRGLALGCGAMVLWLGAGLVLALR